MLRRPPGSTLSPSATPFRSITGTLAVVNADLATLSDTDSNLAADTITLNALDSFGNTAAQKQIAVTVSGLPVPAAPASTAVGVGKPLSISGVSISETGNTTGETFTVTLTDTNGLLSASGGGGTITGSGTTTLAITGTLTQVNTALGSLSDTDSNLAADTITLNANDSFGNTSAQKQIAVTVNGLPVIAAPASTTVGVGKPLAISGVSISETGNTTGETFTVTLTDTNGLLSASGGGGTIRGSGTGTLGDSAPLTPMNPALAAPTLPLHN